MSQNLVSELHQKAIHVQKNAHAPYSHYKIGSAIEFENGHVSVGCNIENASYGGTVCAERVAIWNGISQFPNQKIKNVIVVSDAKDPWPPCGLCLQVIAEFATGETLVHVGNLEKIHHVYKFMELLPKAFTPRHLSK